MTDLIVRGRRVLTPEGLRPAAVMVEEGRIERLGDVEEPAKGAGVVDAGEAVVMPGLVDSHVHVNEPGRTDWEGFETATRAAAAGGVTTLVDMPLNTLPPTTDPEALESKRRAAAGKCRVDVAFWGGLIPGNLAELPPLVEAGVLGFKCFLVPSGVEEFPSVDEEELRRGLAAAAELGVPVLVHAEVPGPLGEARLPEEPDWQSHLVYVASRPPEAEVEAVALVAAAAAEAGARAHILHLSSAEGLAEVRRARREGIDLTAETCPHYLSFTADDVPSGATEFKCAPPIRERPHRDALWTGLARGDLQAVVSDHSPSPPELKQGDFLSAWGGIASLQLGLAATWTGARPRGHGLEDLANWMATGPARLAGLDDRKGAIAPGLDADLVVWDPEATFLVEPEHLEHRHPVTPYAGRILQGAVLKTLVRGRLVYEEGRFPGPPRGELLAGRAA